MNIRQRLTPEQRRHRFWAARLTNSRKAQGKVVTPANCMNCGGTRRIQGHHPDYERPHEIVWLCITCHVRTHREPSFTAHLKPIQTGHDPRFPPPRPPAYKATAEERAAAKAYRLGWHPLGGWSRTMSGDRNRTYFGKRPLALALPELFQVMRERFPNANAPAGIEAPHA